MQIRHLGLADYGATFARMKEFTAARSKDAEDEVWLLEHPPVFTLGLSGNRAHVLDAGSITVVQADRGGQVTYHGPGQLVAYVLLDLRRAGLGIRDLVTALENAVIAVLAGYGITAMSRREAPGVYVGAAKIASLGLRIRGGCSYHGLALNVAMDLEPFSRINPCGYQGLEVTQVADLGGPTDLDHIGADVVAQLQKALQRGASAP